MVGRKKLCAVRSANDFGLPETIEGAASVDSERQAMLKDCHLVIAALATDQIVVSLDEEVRALFRKTTASLRQLRTITWVNPSLTEEGAIGWLENGCQAEEMRSLGFAVE